MDNYGGSADQLWETEFIELNFHVSSMSYPPNGYVGTELEIELTRLDFRKWSPTLHVLLWVRAGDLFPLFLSHYISDIEHSILSVHFSSSQYTQSSLSVHSILFTTLISHNISGIQYYICQFFLLRKIQNILGKVMFYFIFIFCQCKYCD